MIGIIIALLAIIIAIIYKVKQDRERDQDIVFKNTGQADLMDWWSTFKEPGKALRKAEEERLK